MKTQYKVLTTQWKPGVIVPPGENSPPAPEQMKKHVARLLEEQENRYGLVLVAASGALEGHTTLFLRRVVSDDTPDLE